MLRIENLYKVYGNDPIAAIRLLKEGVHVKDIHSRTKQIVAVNNVSMHLQYGEILVVMGLSGSGKSTLLRCINRLTEPTLGSVILLRSYGESKEVNITGLSRRELRKLRMVEMSMVFQDFGLFPFQTTLKNVAFGLRVLGMKKEKRERKALELLELVGLDKWSHAYPGELSGGMQQRVGLARALATGANILLMDEPFSALDPLIRYELQDELKKLQVQLNKSIIFVSHDLGEALRIGDRIAIMDSGQIVQLDKPEQILINPKTKYVQEFVKNADGIDTITARTLALAGRNLHLISRNDSSQTFSISLEGNEIHYTIANDGKLKKCTINDEPIQVIRVRSEDDLKNAFPNERKAVLVDCDVKMRNIIRYKKSTTMPIIVASENSTFIGVVTEEEIFKGMLKELSSCKASNFLEQQRSKE